MIISEDPKFICFQPWKRGSSTLYRRLRKFDTNRYPQGPYFNETLGKVSHKHIGLDDFFQLPESRQDYVRCTFVRNPYDRLYSGFLQRRDRLRNKPVGRLDPEKIKEELNAIERGFGAFARYFISKRKAGFMLSGLVYHNQKPAVDLVGFVETFDASFAQICDKIGIHEADGGNENVRLAGSDPKPSPAFPTARYRYIDRFDRGTIELVNENFGKDCQSLGYRMIEPGDMDADGRLIDGSLSPFSDVTLPERHGTVLALDRRGG